MDKYLHYMYDVNMIDAGYWDFEWDDVKAAINERKHGVTFDEATEAFDDPWARVIDDPDHSDQEERFILMGMSLDARSLTVCHCIRHGSTIRIISARRSTRNEERQYWRCRR